MAKPKPKPKMLPFTGMPGVAMQPVKAAPKPAPTATPSWADIAKAFGGADKATAFSAAQQSAAVDPPWGSYDPQLDAQGGTQHQTADYAAQDYLLGNQYRLDDYRNAINAARTTHDYTLADLQTASNRDLADYTTRTSDLGTQYGRLGTSQTQSANAAGVGGGGALVAAAAARAGNQAHDQSAIDTGYQRQVADINQSRDRENQGFTTQWGDQPDMQGGLQKQAYDRSQAGADLGNQRSVASTALFDQQLKDQRAYQAAQGSGWLQDPNAPAAPAYTTHTHNGVVYHKYPDGRDVPVRKVVKKLT